MSYRQMVSNNYRQIVRESTQGLAISKETISKLATLLYDEHQAGASEGYQVGYDAARNAEVGAEEVKDRISAFQVGLDWGYAQGLLEAAQPLMAAWLGQQVTASGAFKVYTDDRGLTFERGGKAYVQVIDGVYTIEGITETDIMLSYPDGLCETFPIECCRPVLGYDTKGFLPLGAIVIRADGQLGAVMQNNQEDGRFVGYGAVDCPGIDYDLSAWSEYQIEPGTWVATPGNIWYQVVSVGDFSVELDDDGPRYKSHRLPFPDTLPIPLLRVNPEGQKYFVGQRVFVVNVGRYGFIVDKMGDEWLVTYDDEILRRWVQPIQLLPIEFYVGQHGVYDNSLFTIEAVGLSPVDGRLQIVRLRLQAESGDIITVDSDDTVPLTKIDTSEGTTLWMALDIVSLSKAERFRSLLTERGKQQIISIARYLEVI